MVGRYWLMSLPASCICGTHYMDTHTLHVYKERTAILLHRTEQADRQQLKEFAHLQKRPALCWLVLSDTCLIQWLSSDWREGGWWRREGNATGKFSSQGSNFSGQVEFLQVYRFSFWNTIYKNSLKFVSENIFKQDCGKNMFMLDIVSSPSLWYLLGEYVYTLLSSGIYRAKMPLGKCDSLFFCTIIFWKTYRLQENFQIRAYDFKINNSNYRALL